MVKYSFDHSVFMGLHLRDIKTSRLLICGRFHIMGGECNYVLRVARPDMRLQFVPDDDWKSTAMMSWASHDIARLLSDAERILTETAHRLRLPVTVPSLIH